MMKLISQNQTSFISGRDIKDNIIVTQEVIHSLRNFHGNKRGMILKIDLEKAYNRLSWDFLQHTLSKAGLLRELIHVIM